MTRIRVGAVDIRTDMDLSYKQLRRLMVEAGALAVSMQNIGPEPTTPATIGFAAHVERSPETDVWIDPP